MHALRVHKDRVPGRGKAREIRKLLQVTRQRDSRRSILQGLRSFLTADSFMYGPLMEAPSPVTTHSDGSQPHTPEREQENGGLDDDDSTRDDENGEENDRDSGKNVDNGHDESTIRRYRGSRSSSKTIVSVQRTARVQKPSRNGT